MFCSAGHASWCNLLPARVLWRKLSEIFGATNKNSATRCSVSSCHQGFEENMIFIPTRMILILSFSPLEDGSVRIVPWQQDFSISFTEATKENDSTVPAKHFVLKEELSSLQNVSLTAGCWSASRGTTGPSTICRTCSFMLQPKRCSLLFERKKKKTRKGKCWRTSWIGRHTGVITQHTGKLWWFNSHANYLNQCAKRHCFFKEAAHAPYAGTRAHAYTHTHPRRR